MGDCCTPPLSGVFLTPLRRGNSSIRTLSIVPFGYAFEELGLERLAGCNLSSSSSCLKMPFIEDTPLGSPREEPS